MTAEIIDLTERRNKRIVRVVRRRPEGFYPYGLVIPAAALVGLAMWSVFIINTFAIASRARPPT